jgi:ribosome recycling factor
MFSRVMVDYYGAPTPLNQVAGVSIPEARMVIIKPYDMSQLHAVEKAIRNSDLGVNPTNDGQIIRVVVPQLSEERRKEMVKLAKSKGEDARVSVRNVRRKAKDDLEALVKNGDVSEDEGARAEKELQGLTDRYVHEVDELVKHKESDLLEV